MKLSLKNIKHTSWASHETHCFQAALYVDGKPVAIVGNDGKGACDYEHNHPKCKADYRATMKAVHDYFKSLPKEKSDWCEDGFSQTLECWCGDQVNYFLSSRELKRKLKSHVLFQFKYKDGIFQTKYYPSVTKGNWVINKQSGETRRILNDMPFNEALMIWEASA
tara:strand:+ start:125 stop:619 length:495 start_codon:yes stop_codon:yes gene_type:complete